MDQQAHRIGWRQFFSGSVPMINELLLGGGLPQPWDEFRWNIIVETEVRRFESLLKNRHAGEQGDGAALNLVWRGEENFPIAFKECARDVAHDVLRKSDGAVFQRDLDGSAV